MRPVKLTFTVDVDVSEMTLIDAEKLARSGIRISHVLDGIGVIPIKSYFNLKIGDEDEEPKPSV